MQHKIHFGQYALIRLIIDSYKHDEPLHLFLKSFFRKNKKCGSRDRRIIKQQVYNYYRLGHAFPNADAEKRLAIADFIISGNTNGNFFTNDVADCTSIDDRLNLVETKFPEFNRKTIFPFADELSEEIDQDAFIKSFLKRPDVWIRIRKGFEKYVEEDFRQLGIEFEIAADNKNAWRIKTETNLDVTESYQKGYFEIQDVSSQQTGVFFQPKPNELWLDCCCGAGGKSLLLMDLEPTLNLMVSDVREPILENLKMRFSKAGIQHYKSFVADLSIPNQLSEIQQPDSIIADVPCTGSGTWARNPEELYFFKRETINLFKEKQIAIAINAGEHLRPNGKLIYITCSVFKSENEGVCGFLDNNSNLRLHQGNYIKGYNNNSDTLFVAVFTKK